MLNLMLTMFLIRPDEYVTDCIPISAVDLSLMCFLRLVAYILNIILVKTW